MAFQGRRKDQKSTRRRPWKAIVQTFEDTLSVAGNECRQGRLLGQLLLGLPQTPYETGPSTTDRVIDQFEANVDKRLDAYFLWRQRQRKAGGVGVDRVEQLPLSEPIKHE